MDTSRRIFQLHGLNQAEQPILRWKLNCAAVLAFFARLPPTEVAIEACGASHCRAHTLGAHGHTVKLIAPQLSKPCVKRGENDAVYTEGLCEATSRPTMRFVPVKTVDQQAALMLTNTGERLARGRTQQANTIRGHTAEFGLTAAKGLSRIEPLLEELRNDETMPPRRCRPWRARCSPNASANTPPCRPGSARPRRS